ncbi:MAG: DUF4292 domain-containing protein [Bacteroidetes bacterium]|nr:MAG: DUF4292 domain-containing protein [Bacteroidota bacterium]
MRLLPFFLLLIAFSACKRTPIVASPTDKPVEIVRKETKDTAQHAPVGKHFRYLKASAKVQFKDAQNNVSFKVNLRMRKDSAILVLISKMGFNGVRALITPDSVKIIDYQNNEYTTAKFDTIQKIFNFRLDYSMLEAVLLANMPIEEFDSSKVMIVNNLRKINQERDGIAITNFLNDTQKLQELHLRDIKTNNLLQLFYQNFKTFDGNLFAETNRIMITSWNKKSQRMEESDIDMEYNEVKFMHHPIEFTFNVPSKFKRKP